MILVTGASGFLGGHIVRHALTRGIPVRALVRRPTPELEAAGGNGTALCFHHGDLTQPESLAGALDGVTAVVHAAATTSETAPDEELSRRVNVEGTRHLLAAAEGAGVSRWVQISSLSANPANTSVYGRTKYAADEAVRGSRLRWTILRPGTIYGPGARGLFAKIVRLVGGLPVVPVLGAGRQSMRPIYVDDCSTAAVEVLEHETAIGQAYDLGCQDVITFNDFVRGVLEAQGKRKPLLHIPLWFCFPASLLMGLVLKNPPVTVDNLVGLKQMAAPEISPAQRDFGFHPVTFREGLARTFAIAGGTAPLASEKAGAS